MCLFPGEKNEKETFLKLNEARFGCFWLNCVFKISFLFLVEVAHGIGNFEFLLCCFGLFGFPGKRWELEKESFLEWTSFSVVLGAIESLILIILFQRVVTLWFWFWEDDLLRLLAVFSGWSKEQGWSGEAVFSN